MSDIDQTEAVEAGVNAFYGAAGMCFDDFTFDDVTAARRCMSAAIAAAAPLLEAQVREQAWREGFAAGFTASGEGWNGEISSDRGTLDWDIDEAKRESQRGMTS